MSRRGFLRAVAKTSFLGGALTGAWAFVIQPLLPRLYEVKVRLPGLGIGKVRLVQLSDFHAHPAGSTYLIKKTIEMALAAQPDIVVITGDYVSHKAKYAQLVLGELAILAPPLGIWTVLGNHDHWVGRAEMVRQIEQSGIGLLNNRGVMIEKEGARFYLCGVDDIWEGAEDIEGALAGRDGQAPVVLLCHNPDFIYQAARHRINLMLSGHTHGGQIKLPFMGAPIVPSVYGNRFAEGMHEVEGCTLYVNRGIGCITPPIRLGVPPEVTVVELVNE